MRSTLVLLTLLALILGGSVVQGAPPTKSVLILNSYHQGFLWADGEVNGLTEGLKKSDLHIDLSIEYMDIIRQPSPFDTERFTEHLEWRLAGRKFDLIVATDNAALMFVLDKYDELFEGIPIVFSDVDGLAQISLRPGIEITGVKEFNDFGSTIDFALHLRPKTRRIVVFGNTLDNGGGPTWALRYFQSAQIDVPVEIHLDKSFEEILDIAAHLSPRDMIFPIAVAYDAEGKLHDYGDVRLTAANVSAAPSFAFWGTGVVEGGAVGGKLSDPFAQGQAAAELVIRVLNGENASDIPAVPAPLSHVFHYPSLERHGIDPSDLPEDSVFLNKPYSVYEDYKIEVWTAVGVIVGLIGAVFVLLINIRRRKAAEAALAASRDHLEEEVTERTAELVYANESLSETLSRLERTRNQLIESEKMASLGGLVSGVAHEINTPLGVSLTAASHFEESARRLGAAYERDDLDQDQFESFLADAEQTAHIVTANLNRAAALVRGFKQVAVDQSNEEIRGIDLKSYLETTVDSLMPELKHGKHGVEIECPEDIEIETYPGIIAQILSNLILNSARHGFEPERTGGKITIRCAALDGTVTLSYRDDGKGMTPEVLKNAFEPFFTTARGKGGSGLGLSIVYNLVTHKLKGRIACESTPGRGTMFVISMPENVAEAEIAEARANRFPSPTEAPFA